MSTRSDIIIIGGGLAGLTAGLHLARQGFRVDLFEKHAYPHHKVCGEYISNEVRPYLESLGLPIEGLKPSTISNFLLTTASGHQLESSLPLGGFGLSRYRLDQALAELARTAGLQLHQESVTDIQFRRDQFHVSTQHEEEYESPLVIAAYGKRSGLDKQLLPSPWMAVKAHYQAHFPDDLIALNTFPGGYCGLSQVENKVVNACYLVKTQTFKPYRNPEEFQAAVLAKNPFLKSFFSRATPVFDKPMAISQVSFAAKPTVENHILRCGDTAGLIHPLCGNGMAMAIHSAKLAAEAITEYHQHKNRTQLEDQYTKAWREQFSLRLKAGRVVQQVLQQPGLSSLLLKIAPLIPGLIPKVIRQTHGPLIQPAYVTQYS